MIVIFDGIEYVHPTIITKFNDFDEKIKLDEKKRFHYRKKKFI